MSSSPAVPRGPSPMRIVQVIDLTGPAPVQPSPPPPSSFKNSRNHQALALPSPSPPKKSRPNELDDQRNPLAEWENDLDVFSYRFETVVAEWKKSRGKLRDLEAARGPPPSSKTSTGPTSANSNNVRKSAASINPFFLLLPPSSSISPASLILVWFAAEHMLNSSPTGLAGAQRFVQVYEGGRHKAAQQAAAGVGGAGNGGSAVARQNAVMTELIYSALGWLGVKSGGLPVAGSTTNGVAPLAGAGVGPSRVTGVAEGAAGVVDKGSLEKQEERGRAAGAGGGGEREIPASAWARTQAAMNALPPSTNNLTSPLPLPTQPPPPFPTSSTDLPPSQTKGGLGARIRQIALSPTRLFRPNSSSSPSSPTTSPTTATHPSSPFPSSSVAPTSATTATLAAPVVSRSSSSSAILANPTTSQYQQHHRMTSTSPPSSIHHHPRPSSPLAPAPAAPAPPVLSTLSSSLEEDKELENGLTARERVLQRNIKSSGSTETSGGVSGLPPASLASSSNPIFLSLPPATPTSPDTFSSSLPSERPLTSSSSNPSSPTTWTQPTPESQLPSSQTSGTSSSSPSLPTSSRRSLLGRVHHRSARMLSASGITLPPLPGQGQPPPNSTFTNTFSLPSSSNPTNPNSTSNSSTSPPSADGSSINFFFTPFPTSSPNGVSGAGGGGPEQSMMAAKKYRGAGAMRSGSGPVAGTAAARRVVGAPAGAEGVVGKKEEGEGGSGGGKEEEMRVGVAI